MHVYEQGVTRLREPMGLAEKTFLTKLCAQGLPLSDIRREMDGAARERKWPSRDRKTISRGFLAWHLVTETLPAGYAGPAQVSGDFEAHGGTQKYLDDMCAFVKAQEISRESHARHLLDPQHQAHLHRMYELAQNIRQFIRAPQPGLDLYVGTDKPLFLGGQDWALEPSRWVMLAVPDLGNDEPWGNLMPELRLHSKASSFWDHLKELHEDALALEKLYADEIPKLDDANLVEEWRRQRPSAWMVEEVSRNPLFPDSACARAAYSQGLTVRILDALHRRGLDVYERLWKLYKAVQQLHHDLMPELINPVIEGSECGLCPHRVVSMDSK